MHSILDHIVLDHVKGLHPAEAHDGKALATILPDHEKQRELFEKWIGLGCH